MPKLGAGTSWAWPAPRPARAASPPSPSSCSSARPASASCTCLIAPPEARRKIHAAAAQALTSKELAEAFAAVGGVVGGGASEQVRAFIAEETERWAAIIKGANVKLE